MPTPTEPGYYWVTTVEHPEPFVACFQGQPPGWQELYDRPPVVPLGEWGERIPDNDTLKARREMAEQEPNTCLSSDYDDYVCFYCGADGPMCGEIDHKPDCPWLRAQEAPDADAD